MLTATGASGQTATDSSAAANPGVSASVAPPPTDTAWRWDVGLHTRAEWSDSVAPALGLRLGLGKRFGGFLELDAAFPRSASLGVGTITWNRFSGGLGVRWQAPLGRVLLEPGLSVDVAALWVRSRGYTVDDAELTADVGACAHLRAGYRFGPLIVLGGLRACAWPTTIRVTVPSVPGNVALPTVDLSLVAGLAWEVTGFPSSGLSGEQTGVTPGP